MFTKCTADTTKPKKKKNTCGPLGRLPALVASKHEGYEEAHLTACQKNELFKRVKDTCYYRYRLKSLCVHVNTVLATHHVEFTLLHNKQTYNKLAVSRCHYESHQPDYLTFCGFVLRFGPQTRATTSPGVPPICLRLNLFATPKSL